MTSSWKKENSVGQGYCEKLISQFEFQTKKESIRLSLTVAGDIRLVANKSLIEIMLSNLLSNAIRHNI